MLTRILGALTLLCCVIAVHAEPADRTVSDGPVVTIDLMRTLPGEQAAYLRFVAANWQRSRDEAIRRGWILDREVLYREPDGEQWDVMLRTTYRDAAAWSAREALFLELFALPEFETRFPDGKGPREMAEFLDSGEPAGIASRSAAP